MSDKMAEPFSSRLCTAGLDATPSINLVALFPRADRQDELFLMGKKATASPTPQG
jgi:hypothetical protein